MKNYIRFLLDCPNPLVFGMTLMLASSLGQTYFIAIFGVSLRSEFSLTDGSLGALYAGATVISALTLSRVGRWIDRTTVPRFTVAVVSMLALGCLTMYLCTGPASLVVAFFLLRLCGQGLMVHTALTATARAFSVNRGTAISVVALGLPLGEAVLPSLTVFAILTLGWRNTWMLVGSSLLLLALVSLRLLSEPRKVKEDCVRTRMEEAREQKLQLPTPASGETSLWRDRRFQLSMPAILASPFISTGFFFHQVRLASEMRWSMAWVATAFVAYAVARVAGMIAAGPLIDRFAASRVLPVVLIPQMIALLLVAMLGGDWVAIPYFTLFGITSALVNVLATALWVEMFGPTRLASVRASVEAMNVLATGASPLMLGLLIDAGVGLAHQALACAIYCLLASMLAYRLASESRGVAPSAGHRC
ncbi:MFS transporter [Achromobacter sp. LC458]|uniref:MFS transporter n=1 Tax=Achromobacter TaxID=222 RepID=UPI000629DD77|nr:MFS transporter [Achromobacter sp. LC458]TRM51877.1 MFS transporter [Achromobacter sp. LC458]